MERRQKSRGVVGVVFVVALACMQTSVFAGSLSNRHRAGWRNVRRNWRSIKSNADAAGFAAGSYTATAGATAGGVVGPVGAGVGYIIGHQTPEAVTGMGQVGYYYAKDFLRRSKGSR